MKFNSIQYLRSVAILLVFFYHGYVISGKYYQHEGVLQYFKYSGMIGVILFFVISGFIMSYILHIQEKNFYLKRFLRIYPVFMIAVMVIIFLKVLFFGAIKEPYLAYAMTLLPLEVMKITSVSGNTIVPSYPLGIEWSLIFELFFYLIVGMFNNVVMRKFFIYFNIVWLFIIIYMYFQNHTALSTRVGYSEIFFSLYNIPFILGVLTFSLYNKIHLYRQFFLKQWCFLILIILFIIIANICIEMTNNHFLRVVIITLLGSLLILLSVLSRQEVFENMTVLNIGNHSYGIYLLHLGLLSIFFSALHNILLIQINIFWIAIVLTLSFSMSYLYGQLDIRLYNTLKYSVQSITDSIYLLKQRIKK